MLQHFATRSQPTFAVDSAAVAGSRPLRTMIKLPHLDGLDHAEPHLDTVGRVVRRRLGTA